MKEDIREYAKLGLVHHLLYGASAEAPEAHVETLLEFIQRTDIETFDCCLPSERVHHKKLISKIKNCGKSCCYAIHFYPLRSLPLAGRTAEAKKQTWEIIDGMIEQAVAVGAEGFIFGAGTPSFYDATEEDFVAFDEFCHELCAKLQAHNIIAMLEPFDMDIDKKFLYGPVDECVKLAERMKAKHDNFGFELDVAHLPLMREDFASAIERGAPYLKRVHLGNCVLKDKGNPRWGDTHPPIGFDGGEIDIPELVVILKALLDCGFLDKNNRGNLLIEMKPFPGRSVEFTIEDNFTHLKQAWRKV
jgi:sugar phosphate isomerase/epimerase